MDLSDFLNWFMNLMSVGVLFAFDFLASIKFWGTNLLVFIITLHILFLLVSILLAIKPVDFNDRRRKEK